MPTPKKTPAVRSPEYCVVCDDVRIEHTGKLIIIGMYAEDIQVQTLPGVLLRLCFLARLTSLLQHQKLEATIKDGSGEDTAIPLSIALTGQPGPSGASFVAGTFINVVLKNTGSYTLSLRPPSGKGRAFKHIFRVVQTGPSDRKAHGG